MIQEVMVFSLLIALYSTGPAGPTSSETFGPLSLHTSRRSRLSDRAALLGAGD
jgi:hypothetical protein